MELVVNNVVREKQELPELLAQMDTIIDNVNEYSLKRGELGGLDWGYKSFNDAFEGLNPGLHIIGGQPNVGKSCLCLQLAWTIANVNRTVTKERPYKAYVLYISLDDNLNDLLPRVVAMDQKIPIGVVTKPKKYAKSPDNLPYMVRREEGIKRLKSSIPYFKALDSNYLGNCDRLDVIEKTIRDHQATVKELDEAYKLVVFIDNYHDLTTDVSFHGDNNGKFEYIANELTRMCTAYDIPIICTAELKKVNGMRRPIYDDIRESSKTSYEAKATILCFNEVGLRGESAQVYWEEEGRRDKRPVLELYVAKNKLASFKGRMFFEFVPEMSYLREATEAGSIRYSQIISG
jgi:replicative DNA helicase